LVKNLSVQQKKTRGEEGEGGKRVGGKGKGAAPPIEGSRVTFTLCVGETGEFWPYKKARGAAGQEPWGRQMGGAVTVSAGEDVLGSVLGRGGAEGPMGFRRRVRHRPLTKGGMEKRRNGQKKKEKVATGGGIQTSNQT